MQLGTLDRTPPPFFRQGVSALTKLLFFSALAVFLMVADGRFQLVVTARAVLATALLPVERALMVPREILLGGRDYLEGISQARAAEDAARVQMVRQAERVAQVDLLERENQRLRALLELRPALTVRSLAAEVLYEAADPFSRKVFIDRGERHGVVAASPVVNESGVMGQVTRVFPLTAEVTLLTDKDAAIPVLNTRTQQRSAAFGGPGQGAALELRYMAANSDVKAGDVLTTSGVDGVYPAGLPVATVASVERQADAGFARITLHPSAPLDGVRHVLVLEPLSVQLPPQPEPAPEPTVDPRSKRKP